MLGRRANKPGGGVAEQSKVALDRVAQTGTMTMPSHHLFAPPKLFLATTNAGAGAGADEVAVSEHTSEAVTVSPTSIPEAGSSHTSPAACHVRSSGGAVNPFSRCGSSGGDRRSQCRRRRPCEARPVGLGLAGALNGEATGAATPTAVLAGRRLRAVHATSAPCSPSPAAASEEFGGKSCCRSPAFAGHRFMSPREVEASEDYTRVITSGRGPNARTTYIFDDRVVVDGCGLSAGSGDGEFLRWCHGCSKELGQGKDIFMYRGKMAFCSQECDAAIGRKTLTRIDFLVQQKKLNPPVFHVLFLHDVLLSKLVF